MFVDEARIFAASGSGGDGMVHFRREKYIPRGGPDGGDGGKGGDVILEASSKLGSLTPFRGKVHHRAQPGKSGGGNRRAGKSGVDLILGVPRGTIVVDEGARRVILENGKSLLPSGIHEVLGQFGAGDSVAIGLEVLDPH
jgi:GTP-binding protein